MSDLVQFLSALKAQPRAYGGGRTMTLAEQVTGKKVEQLDVPRTVNLGDGHWVAVGHERPEDRGAVAVAVLERMLQ